MDWRNITGKAGKLGYDGNLGFTFSDLVEDIKKGRVNYIKIPLDEGIFEMHNTNQRIEAVLGFIPNETQLGNLYLKLIEDLADLNGDYNSASLYLGTKNARQVIPKYSEDGYEIEEYKIKEMSGDLEEIIYERELVEKLKKSSSVTLTASKFRDISKGRGRIEQSLFLNITLDSFEMHAFAYPSSTGIDLLGSDGMGGFIDELDIYVDSEVVMELKESYLNSGRRFLKRATKPFYKF